MYFKGSSFFTLSFFSHHRFPHYIHAFRCNLVAVICALVLAGDAFASSALQGVAVNDSIRQRLEAWSAGYPAKISSAPIRNSALLNAYYEETGFAPLWLKDSGRAFNSAALDLISVLQGVDKEGLLPADYHTVYLGQLITEPSEISSDAELVLTDAFLFLAQHILAGKVDPETLTNEWKPAKEVVDARALLTKVASNVPIADIVQSLRPRQPRYARLVKTLAWLNSAQAPDWEPLALSPAIKKGMADTRLAPIAERLRFWGDLSESESEETFTHYEGELMEAVTRFQRRHGLEPDGVVGKNTLLALNVSPVQRANDVVVNLERWRWLDQNMGDYFIVVNIANFDLRVYKSNELVMQKPVIVGRNYRKTPVFSDKIRFLVFNPTWTVPQKLAVQDKLPEIKKDISYLEKYGFTLYALGENTVVNPADVEWDKLHKRFPYRMVQAPGPLNALGQVKFMFPNAYDVYLHDTPSRELFSKTERAFSSGCIRVSDPIELASKLLEPNGMGIDQINEVLSSAKTTTVNLKTPVPVHIEYWTAWVDSSGKLQFRNDIYERDKPLFSALSLPIE